MTKVYQIFSVEHYGTMVHRVPNSNVEMTPIWDGNSYDGNVLSFNTVEEAEEYLNSNESNLKYSYYVILPIYIK